jgi:hypothetical protein
VPDRDIYSFTVPGATWIDIHWLHQLVLHTAYSWGGHEGAVILKVLTVVLLTALVASLGWRRDRPLVSHVALVLMLLIAADRFMPRPELPTFVFLAAELVLLQRFARHGDGWIYGIVPIQLLWANVHGLFALGLALIAMSLAAEFLHPLLFPEQPRSWPRIRRLGAVLLLSLGATLVNPNGLDGALYPLQQLNMIGGAEDRGLFGAMIAELIPPLARAATGSLQPQLLFFAALVVGSLGAMAANWRRLATIDVFIWVAFLYLALGAFRNVALFAVVATPIFVRNVHEFLDARAEAGKARAATRGRAAALNAAAVLGTLALAGAASSGWLYERLGGQRAPGLGVMETFHPVGAVDWIEKNRPQGPICHHMADGGYLIWRLHPDYPVMTDGRLEVYGEQRFLELQFPNPDAFRAVDERYSCGLVMIRYSLIDSFALLRWLYFHPRWQLVFVDEAAALFAGAPAAGAIRWPEVDVDAEDLFDTGSADRGIEDLARRRARTVLFGALGRPERALALHRETAERYPDSPDTLQVQVMLLQQAHREAEAEQLLRRHLEDQPDELWARVRLSDLMLTRGDLLAAREQLDAALEVDPFDAGALQRSGLIAERSGDLTEAVRLYALAFKKGRVTDPAVVQAVTRLRALGVYKAE